MNDDYYDIPGIGPLPRVTAILTVISKPALMAWQAKQGSLKARNVMERLKEMAPYVHDALKKEFGDAFFKDGYAQAAEAADYGKQAHALIEKLLKKQITWQDDSVVNSPEPVFKALQVFWKWKQDTEFEIIKSESRVHSKTFGYAGTLDAIGKTKYGVTLLDWKTSKALHPEYSVQTVAYKYAAEELSNETIPNIMICRFGKDGSFEDYTVPKMKQPDLFETFLDAKRLWEWQKQNQKAA